MTQKPDGGPAFAAAWVNHEQGGDYVTGMSLRDYFAAHASEEDIKAHQEWGYHGEAIDFAPKYTREQARYLFADAMIAARGAE